MSISKIPRWMIVVMVWAVLAALQLGPALAQDGGEEDPIEVLVEIEGVVEVVDANFIVVDGYTVAPAGVFDPLTTVAVGDYVIITGELLPDGRFQATALTVVADPDADGLEGDADNCPLVANLDQLDTDADGLGDACDPDLLDTDEDDVVDAEDNCPLVANPAQLDTDADGLGDACESDGSADEPLPACAQDDQPVATALAAEFEIEYAVIMGWFCEDGFGFGEIARALLIAEQAEGVDVETLLAMAAEGLGWGEIMQEYQVQPSDLAPGRVISAQKQARQQTEEAAGDQTQQQTQQRTQEQFQEQTHTQDGPGNSENAPGQNKDEAPGNSENAPGQNKDKSGKGK